MDLERLDVACRLPVRNVPAAVAHAWAVHGVSQRRACEALAVDRSSVRYRSLRPADLEPREAMKAVASERRRFGYRRIRLML